MSKVEEHECFLAPKMSQRHMLYVYVIDILIISYLIFLTLYTKTINFVV